MKYCHRCGTGNENNPLFCQGCGKPLQKNAREQSREMSCQASALQEEKERRRRQTGLLLLIFIYALHLTLGICLLSDEKATALGIPYIFLIMLLFPGIGYLKLFKAESMFKLKHFFSIKNPDQVEPSELYLLCSYLAGAFIWALGIAMLAVPLFF